MPKTCLSANSGGTNAVFGNGVLRTHRARRNQFAALRGLHPFQSRQTWIVRQCPRLGVFVVPPLCAGRMAAFGLGRHKRNGGNEFWGVNVIIKLPYFSLNDIWI